MAYYNLAQEQPQLQDQYPPPIDYYAAPEITYQSEETIRHYGPYYEKQTSTGLGGIQIVLACISIAAGVMAIVYGTGCYYVGIGIWAGVWYLIAGSVAIAAGKEPTNNLITATLVFSVFDILLGTAQIVTAATGASQDNDYCAVYNNNCKNWWAESVIAHSLMISAGTFELIFGICLTVISGHAINKGSKQQCDTNPLSFEPNEPETMYMQGSPPSSAFQSQPPPYYDQPPPYSVQAQHPSSSNQKIHVGVHQVPLTTIKC